LSLERGFKLFDSLVENRVFSLALLVCATAGLGISLLFSWGSFVSVFDAFKYNDLYKIALFASGVSPYSPTSLAQAPYPPFYFMIWALPYLFFSDLVRLSFGQIYFALRFLSTLLSGLCGALIYKQLILQGFSKQKAVSLGSLFVLCSLIGLIGLVGDFFGLIFLSLGCWFLLTKKLTTGLVLVSVAVVFKVQPILGLALLVISLVLLGTKEGRKYEALRYTFAVGSVGVCLGLVPILLIPNAINSFFVYGASHVEYFSFNIYGGLSGVLTNLLPNVSSSAILESVNIVWISASISLAFFFALRLLKSDLLSHSDPVDLLGVGTMVWFILLKQTMPHYFLWALVPLLAKGRTRSMLYVLAGEFFGMLFFGIGYLFPIPANYAGIPTLNSSLAFLLGGVLFTVFMCFALMDLLKIMRKEREESLQGEREEPVLVGTL
jgi:hypothetical protein